MTNAQTARFEDSSAAQAHIDQLGAMLQSPALLQWVIATDVNFGTSVTETLRGILREFAYMQEDLTNAC